MLSIKVLLHHKFKQISHTKVLVKPKLCKLADMD